MFITFILAYVKKYLAKMCEILWGYILKAFENYFTEMRIDKWKKFFFKVEKNFIGI